MSAMNKTTVAYVKLVRDEHGTIIHSENADDLVRDAVAAEREACLEIACHVAQTFNSHACVYVADLIRKRRIARK